VPRFRSPPAVPHETAAAVECRGISKTFAIGGRLISVLRGIDLTAPRGRLTLIVGPSGSGKTTLLSIIAGILAPTAGSVRIAGHALDGIAERDRAAFRRAHIGFIFQQYNLLPALTAAENVAVPLVAAGSGMTRAVRAARLMLDRLGLAAHADTRPPLLSGGEQQRIAIARALVHEPRLVLCDEPTAALDSANGAAAMAILRDIALAPERAVIVVSHDTRIVGYADRVCRLEDGAIVAGAGDGLP
jgi:putative ABC transport system ATP-binding protein